MCTTPREELLKRYGELMQDLDTINDYFSKISIIDKMNSINKQLGYPEVEKPNILTVFRRIEKEIKQ